MYLPYLKALKTYYSGIVLGNLSSPLATVDCRIKSPQKGFADASYPAVGIEYVTFVRDRNRVNTRRVENLSNGSEAIVRAPLEPLTMLFYIHLFSQDSMEIDSLLQQAVMERTPYYFAVNVELANGTYNCEIYSEEPENVIIEGLDREMHTVYPLKVWGWMDNDPIGTRHKILTQINMQYSLSLSDTTIDEEIISLL